MLTQGRRRGKKKPGALNREEMQLPMWQATDGMQYPELHDESVPSIVFIKHLRKLMAVCGVADFSLARDLWKPESDRLQRNLSAIINFVKFREDKLEQYEGHQQQIQELVCKKREAEDLHLKLTAEIEGLKAERAGEMPAARKLEEEVEGLGGAVQQLNREQAELQGECKDLKRELTELEGNVESRNYMLLNAAAERDRLRGGVVHSPEKLKRVLRDLEANIEREEGQAAAAEKRRREASRRYDAVSQVEKGVQKALALMAEAEGEIRKYEEAAQGVKGAKAKIASNETEFLQLEATRDHLKQQHTRLSERLNRLEKHAQLKREAALVEFEEQLKEKVSMETDQSFAKSRVQENLDMCKTLEDAIKDMKATHASQSQATRDKYKALCGVVRKYQQGLEQAIGA